MEQLEHNSQYFSTLSAQSRNLYQTDFEPVEADIDHKKKILQLKLKNQFHYAADKFQKHKDAEENKEKQPQQIDQENKVQGQKKVGLEPEKKSFLDQMIDEINQNAADKKNKIATFQKYENNANETANEKKTENAVVLSNKLEMNLVEATRLGTIKATSIRKLIKPIWHPPYKLYRVIAGHQGWVRAVAVSPCNTFFATGSADRTIKFFDLASGQLKISLTGHINTIRGIQFSDKHPYLFSCGQDKSVKCWDLEMNKVIRNYHGHLSGVYCLKIHQDLSVLVTGGRDSSARVWDIRVRRQIHALTGHSHTVGSVITQEHQPHVVTGSYDSFVKLWDIGQGKCIKTLTNHKKSIRTMVSHPKQYTFATGASDNIKVWKCPNGQFLRNISGHNSIIDSMAINQDGVLVTGGDDGTMKFWDWSSGYNFQSIVSQPQPGSIAAENAIFALTFDKSGSRLITGECDKTIKMYKQDQNATQETHPIKNFKMEFY